MKRSELIEFLTNEGYKSPNGKYSWYYITPEEVLDILEKAGMLNESCKMFKLLVILTLGISASSALVYYVIKWSWGTL